MLRALVITVVACLVFWAVLILAFQDDSASPQPPPRPSAQASQR
jgi:hypothetical protein